MRWSPALNNVVVGVILKLIIQEIRDVEMLPTGESPDCAAVAVFTFQLDPIRKHFT